MTKRFRSMRAALLTCAIAVGLAACTDYEEPSALTGPEFAKVGAGSHADAFSVYTQNLWLGGSTGPLFDLDLTDPTAIGDVIAATQVFWAQVQASNVPERSAEILNEIAMRQPEVVALQEAVQYFPGLLDPNTGEFTVTGLGPDLFGPIKAAIGADAIPYRYEEQLATGIVLPIGGIPNAQGLLPALAIQDRIVMLVHDALGEYDTTKGLYSARIPLGPVDFVRGWIKIEVERDGVPHHFVGTHLEVQGSSDPSSGTPFFIRQVHNGQAAELQNVILEGLDGVTVLMGDLNSDAAADPSVPSWTPTYGNLIDAGFSDVWYDSRRQSDDGVTCCQEDVPQVRVPDQRIDFILVRNDKLANDQGRHRGFFEADVIGDMDSDRTPSGQWPSDHAGVVGTLRLPPGMR